MIIELRTGQIGMRGNGGNHYEKLGHKIMLCASQFIILDTAGINPDSAWNYTDMMLSQPNLASRTPDYSYPLLSSPLFSSSSPITIFLGHNSTIIAEQQVKLSLSMSPCHDHELAASTAYTAYSIHWGQQTPSTSYTGNRIHPRMVVFPSFSWCQVDPWM
jgi:hypothetical protein